MAELWYRLTQIPDLTLNKYASLEEKGVEGVLEKHGAFLRQLNRKGILSKLSFHLYYLYVVPTDKSLDSPGHRLRIFLMIRGEESAMGNVPAMIEASPLSDFFVFERTMKVPAEKRPLFADTLSGADGNHNKNRVDCSIDNVLKMEGLDSLKFDSCAVLTKAESTLPGRDGQDYYIVREWEMNENGRLYNMCKMMEAFNQTTLYRVDLYPVDRSETLRADLRNPMSALRKIQEERSSTSSGRDYEGKDALDNYESLIEKFDSSPHFVANVMVFANGKENAVTILDAAGSEGLTKGRYRVTNFANQYDHMSFLKGEIPHLENLREGMSLIYSNRGLIVCKSDRESIRLRYLPTLFSLEEVAPFFRLPALYDGEVIQIAKETAPSEVKAEGSIYLGKDKNGYDVRFPLNLLPKHAFISGVPGSGKTNTMHHITSTLWKEHHIPFLVLEPAKQEYRALCNDPDMKDLYLFSPNADMSFPLHINPFEMPRGTLIAEHIRKLCDVFEGAFPLEPPMPFLLDTSIESVYRELGWRPDDVYTGKEKTEDGKPKALPTMSMLYKKLEEEVNTTRYSEEVRGNLESALKVRIGSLLRREMGDVFDVPVSTFEPEKWLEVPAVIELESMGTGPANFLTLLLCSLIRETLKAHPKFDGDIRHIIFIEEAHNLIGPESEAQSGADADPKQAATAFVVKMLAEVRALKEGIVIADQLPTVMAQEVLKNTGLKIGLRITSADDRSLLGSTMAASGLQLEEMSTFMIGQALIFYEKLKRPFTMRVKQWWGELGDDEKIQKMTSPKNDSDLRKALTGSRTYTEINYKSIQTTCKKYARKLKEIQQADVVNWLNALERNHQTIQKIKNDLIRIEKGEIEVSESKKTSLYETYEKLETLRIEERNHTDKVRCAADHIETLFELTDTLERLKNGRWSRFGITDADYAAISILQMDIAGLGTTLYKFLLNGLGETKESRKLEKEFNYTSDLFVDLCKQVEQFKSIYGVEALIEKVKELNNGKI